MNNKLTETQPITVTDTKRELPRSSSEGSGASEKTRSVSETVQYDCNETTQNATRTLRRLNLTNRKYMSVTETNRNAKAAQEAAANDPYELKEMMARGAEALLYRAVSGAFTYCSKSIRNNWSKVLGGSPGSGSEKLENVKYSTKMRHIQNEFAISQILNQDGAMPIVRMFALRKVTRFGMEIGYDLLMEYLDGHDLADKILTKVLPLEDKIRVLYQAAQALEYVHKKRIIHLDIKPSNFMLINGKVKLIDFGVSVKSGYHASAITGTGGYLSPEQICKDTIDEKTDIFAFGIAFGVLFGGRPLTQPQEELLTKHSKQEARYQLESIEEPMLLDVPALNELPEIADLLRQCTIPRRDKRMSSCSAFCMLLKSKAEQYNITL